MPEPVRAPEDESEKPAAPERVGVVGPISDEGLAQLRKWDAGNSHPIEILAWVPSLLARLDTAEATIASLRDDRLDDIDDPFIQGTISGLRATIASLQAERERVLAICDEEMRSSVKVAAIRGILSSDFFDQGVCRHLGKATRDYAADQRKP